MHVHGSEEVLVHAEARRSRRQVSWRVPRQTLSHSAWGRGDKIRLQLTVLY